jgi:type IV secretory pathway TraG/TraD family ATPase VirD4
MPTLHFFKDRTGKETREVNMGNHQDRHSRDGANQSSGKGQERHLLSSACLYSNVEGKEIILNRCLAALHLRKMHGIKFL